MTLTHAPDADPDEANTNEIDPLVPRAIDLPTELPREGLIDPAVGDIAKIFAAPADPEEWPAWRERLRAWREEARERLAYSGAAYELQSARWARTCYSVSLTWLWDERLFDHGQQAFTVDRFLAETVEHGGFDGIVLWHAYPIIGIDDRNQFDFYRDVPGLAQLIADFQSRGLKVFIDYNPWDVGTRRPDHDDPGELALIVGELGVDGVFLDTMKEGGAELIDALLTATPPQVLEGESRVQLARIEDHHLSWAQWFADSEAPGVLRAHWYERRHMLHHTRRWNRDHSAELQSSWMNGTGILVWDTVFGAWVGWNPRDAATLRRMLRVQRALSSVLLDGEWTPLVDGTAGAIAAGVYSSRFELGGLRLWTIVNRRDTDYKGDVLEVAGSARRIVDVFGARDLDGTVAHLTVPARGIAAVVALAPPSAEAATTSAAGLDAKLATLLDSLRQDAPSTDVAFPHREIVRVAPQRSKGARPTPRVIEIEAGRRSLSVTFRRRETGMYDGAPYVEEWKPLPPRLHDERTGMLEVDLGHVAVAALEVTAREFSHFVAETGYSPRVAHRFGATPVMESANSDDDGPAPAPATMLNLDDARAYAAWAGARLPTEFEWQVAAGNARFERIRPAVWNWTESEHSDGVTRFVMLKGGSSVELEGSDWYFDGGERAPEFTAKMLLAGLGVERSSAIGFRLAWDLS